MGVKGKKAVRPGCKLTDVGIIPEEWDFVKLGTIAEVVGGGTPSSSISSFWNGNIKWFTPTEIGYQKYLYESERTITEK